MKHQFPILLLILVIISSSGHVVAQEAAAKKVRLFLLSGQSNMAMMNPNEVFTPAIRAAFPEDEVIVVKFAQSGKPIRNWVGTWKPKNPEDKARGNFSYYKKLVADAEKALQGKTPDSVTFIWMQGERDARENYGEEYAGALEDLWKQLAKTYKREDFDFILGRLSDYGVENAGLPGWNTIREAQVAFCETNPAHRAWIDTDAFNETGDGLHYDKEGRVKLANRYVEESVRLIKAEK